MTLGTIRFIGRRLMLVVPLIFAAATLAFFVLRLVPGDPAELIAGPNASKATVDAIRASLLLDRPLFEQYWVYLSKVVGGDFGVSASTGRPVLAEIRQRLPTTFILTAGSMLIALSVGPLFGVLAAFKRNTILDTTLSVVSVAGLSVPSFWLGLMLIFIFANQLQWLPSMGIGSFANWILPCVTLSATTIGLLARVTRSSMLEVMGEQYIWTARAKGIPEFLVVLNHGLRNAMIPVVTVAGTQIGYMLGGAMVTETVFSLPGFGRLIVEAVLSKDYAVVQAGILVTSVLVILVNLFVDLSYFVLDPRMRAGRAA
jgi:ABC-type dipeptide/oligopeptide/nickel transport system permease component